MSAVIQSKAEIDPRVEAAISHWAPRFVANGVPLADFQEVTASISHWEDWCAAWSARAAVHEEMGNKALAGGYNASAAAHFTRAAVCYHFGKFLFVNDMAQMKEAHRRAVECRNKSLPHLDPPGERVAIPYEGRQLYGNLRKPAAQPAKQSNGGAAKPPPIVVMCMGLDSAKEEMDDYENRFLARGLATLAFDGPGQGEAEYDFAICPEYEKPVAAVFDFLATRKDVDIARAGIWGVSLGGYYAPRAAALEPRFACCVAWGAQWDYHAIWAKRLDELASGKVLSLSVPPEHLQWVLGVSSQAAALKKLEGLRLDGIVQKMTCPFLLLHGAGDEQIPLSLAEKCFAAIGSKQKTLKVFSREEGGFHHCQVDNVTIGVHYMWDWIEDVLRPGA